MRPKQVTQYEFSNLPITIGMGKVLTTVTDKKIPVDVGNNDTIDWYVADITSATDSAKCYFETYTYKVQNLHWLMPISKSLKFDKSELLRIHNRYYYPFGSPMDGRIYSGDKYRFGFNGQEKDDEFKGLGNSLDFGERIYDSRLGRFFSIDRLAGKFSYKSPYDFANNTPIQAIDIKGDSVYYVVYYMKNACGKVVPYIHIIVEGAIINLSSNSSFNVNKLAEETNSESTDLTMFDQTVSNMTFKDSHGNVVKADEAEVYITFKMRGVSKMSEVKSSDHLMVVSDFVKVKKEETLFEEPNAGGVASFQGKIAYMWEGCGSGSSGATTVLHEIITHNLGLSHNRLWFMITTGLGVGMLSGNISDNDLKNIINNIDNGLLNKGNNSVTFFGKKYPTSLLRSEFGEVYDVGSTGTVNIRSVQSRAFGKQ